ncbi:MAG: hypothetical protein ACJA16_001138 [Akkermansiaceae bacterium]|jgi:hypothetical protein
MAVKSKLTSVEERSLLQSVMVAHAEVHGSSTEKAGLLAKTGF